MILGIDEVGRGPWAGPLVVGAVVLGGAEIDGLTDSKKLIKKRREELSVEIYDKAAAVGLGWVSAIEIDQIGLGPALRLATRRAVQEVKTPFHEIIIDGTINLLSDTPLEKHVTTLKKADLLVPSVSAASIVAKVVRDRYMAQQDEVYPGYKFAAHAGYGTAAHRQAIDQLGVTPLHRLSFAPLVKYKKAAAESSRHASRHTWLRRVFSSDYSLSSAELASAQASSTIQEESDSKTWQPHNDSKHTDSDSSAGSTRAVGDASESVAEGELVRRGHQIIARNWKTKYCEIDIVSQKGDVYYFTEVKHRKSSRSGDGLAAITPKKLNQMKFAAKFYAHNNDLEKSHLRLLTVATSGEPPVVEKFVEID